MIPVQTIGWFGKLSRKVLPGFKTGHTLYVQFVKDTFTEDCRWLDAGGGAAIFHDVYDGERELVERARIVVAADRDAASLVRHVSVSERVNCDLAHLPLQSDSFDLVTCGMVVEHLADPLASLKEMARVLDRGGLLVVHTVNVWGLPTLAAIVSKVVPAGLRRRLIAWITRRQEEDIFPTYYRCNSAHRIASLLREAGLSVQSVEYLPTKGLFQYLTPLNILELLYTKLTLWPWLRALRGQLLVTATKL